MIIADTITGFNQAAISTGGRGSLGGYYSGAGYGGTGSAGAGGYNGGGSGGLGGVVEGGGGSSGWAFIYCNKAVNQDITDTVYF